MKTFDNLVSQLPYGYYILRTIDRVRYDFPNFLKNAWIYRKALTDTHDFDAMSGLRITGAHLKRVADYLETRGNEVEEHRLKKVKMMRRAVELIELHLEEEFIEWAEREMGEAVVDGQIYFEKIGGSDYSMMKDRLTAEEKAHNGRIYKRAQEIATETWMELFEILRGQDTRVYSILTDLYREDYHKQAELWEDWFDGSGLKHWWD
jgi:hypothetical protein